MTFTIPWLEWANLMIRWLHLAAGIAWIGTSFYFIWLDFSLRWAMEAGVDVQPVVDQHDKSKIGELLSSAPEGLRHLGGKEFIDLHRSDIEYWEVGMNKLLRAAAVSRRKQAF